MPRQTGDVMRERIKRAIADLTRHNGRPPTNRELGMYLGGKSTGHIDYHLRLMREQGVINHEPRKSRGITLVETEQTGRGTARALRIPLAGQIAAGSPIEATQIPDEYVDLADGMSFEGDVFALRVKGLSMIEDHIDDGDIVIVRRQATAIDGDTVVALVMNGTSEAGDATLKRFYREKGGKIRLQPRNSDMSAMIYSANEVRIQGKAIGILRQV